LGIAVLLLKLPVAKPIFGALNGLIGALQESTQAGTAFVFGYVGGGPLPFEITPDSSTFILAFRALPLALVVSALASVLFYWKILPLIVEGFSFLLQRSLGVGGAEGLGVAANVFLGMVESPLLIQPYLARLTRSELFTVMTAGMATIAGTVMVLYASILSNAIPGGLGHILAASMINAVGAIVISKLMVPETGTLTAGRITLGPEVRSSMDALTQGTVRGVQLLINIVAMLIVLVAAVHLVNLSLSVVPWMGGEAVTLQRIFGWLLSPLAWLLGIPWAEAGTAGRLLGTKMVLNELVAYLDLSQVPQGSLSPRSYLILLYSMCGFANPGSLGIMIGGLGTMVPDRRNEVVELGLRSILAGSMATWLTGAIVSLWL